MGLRAEIYKANGFVCCGDGGLSGRADRVTIVNVNGPSDPSADAPAALLVPNALGTVRIVPAVEADRYPSTYITLTYRDRIGPMMGGSYVGTSDGRFSEAIEEILGHRFYGAVPLHDRYETQAQYDALSV